MNRIFFLHGNETLWDIADILEAVHVVFIMYIYSFLVCYIFILSEICQLYGFEGVCLWEPS